jgi:hypothetical protein
MGIVFSSSLVVIDKFNVKRIIPFKAKNDAPISLYSHGPQPFQFSFKRVQPIARDIQSLRRRGGIENRKNSFDRFHKVGSYPAPIAAFIEAFQASMFKAPDHQRLL